MTDILELECHECGKTTTLGPEEQKTILSTLTRPAQSKILECPCGKFPVCARREKEKTVSGRPRIRTDEQRKSVKKIGRIRTPKYLSGSSASKPHHYGTSRRPPVFELRKS